MTDRNLDDMAQRNQPSDSGVPAGGLPAGKQTRVITVRVPVPLHDRIQRVVDEEGISIADWTRDALLNAVRRAERQLRSTSGE
jgi:hypothetical protein